MAEVVKRPSYGGSVKEVPRKRRWHKGSFSQPVAIGYLWISVGKDSEVLPGSLGRNAVL